MKRDPVATGDPHDRSLPLFGDLHGRNYYALPLKPPFTINNLSTALFPLRANLDSLQGFCNGYLNVIPKELGRFRAFSPYVLLMVMDYGSLALEVTNLGWFSQHEICFCVPVEWYRVINGRWVFQDWAMVTPYIYVDDDLSLPMGRTVAGWPKTFVNMQPTLSKWLREPFGPAAEMTVSAMVFPKMYAGERQEERVFLEIERGARMSNFRLPFNDQSPIMPWTVASNMAQTLSGMGRDVRNLLAGLGLYPTNEGTSPEKYATMLRNVGKMIDPVRPQMKANILNLKQFRASEDPDQYCYQALTNGYMDFTKFNGVGLLGEQALVSGDASGGYSIKLHEWPSLPITRALGLEVHRRWRGEGVDVAEIKPVMPFWYDCNMTYGLGYNLAWRTRGGVWRDRRGRSYPQGPSDAGRAHVESLYNTMLGPSAKPVAGPFRFTGTTIRVMPLLASKAKLQKFLDGYLNDPMRPKRPMTRGKDKAEERDAEEIEERFTLWASDHPGDQYGYVYLTATSFGTTTSATNNVGDWADREIAFMVPVKRQRWVDGAWQLAGVGLVPAFTYVDNIAAAMSGSEVLGIPTMHAIFEEAESSWMSADGPAINAEQVLLRVHAEVLPVVGEGERAVRREIVEIRSGTPVVPNGGLAWRVLGDRWTAILGGELKRKKRMSVLGKGPDGGGTSVAKRARALALEILGNRVPISVYTMKQFRDNADPDSACYQSIVRVDRTLAEVLDLREIEGPMVVRINDFPTQSIVELLGLVAATTPGQGVGLRYSLQPIRPFWMRVTMEEALGKPLRYRAGTREWTENPEQEKSSFELDSHALRDRSGEDPGSAGPRKRLRVSAASASSAELEHPRFSAGLGGVRLQEDGDPRRMTLAAQEGKSQRTGEPGVHEITAERGREAVDWIDPQTIIESILSREWGNWDVDARWRRGRRTLVASYKRTMSGVSGDEAARGEWAFFDAIVKQIGQRPGEPVVDAQQMVERLAELMEMAADVEKTWATLGSLGLLYPADFYSRGTPPTPDETGDAILRFIEAVGAFAGMGVIGEPSAPDHQRAFAARDNASRLRTIINSLQQDLLASATRANPYETGEVAKKILAATDLFREAVDLVRERVALQREALFNRLSKTYQKPDFCVRRDSAGPEADRHFPLNESWDEEWYVGSEISALGEGEGPA